MGHYDGFPQIRRHGVEFKVRQKYLSITTQQQTKIQSLAL